VAKRTLCVSQLLINTGAERSDFNLETNPKARNKFIPLLLRYLEIPNQG